LYSLVLVADRLSTIRNSVKRLKLLAEVPQEEFCTNADSIDIAENRLRRALEALFDVGRHLLVKSGAGVPSDYRSVIMMLAESNILPADCANRITTMAGYRNRLIHDYNKVSPEELYTILQTRLADLELFCRHVVDYLH